MQLKATYSANVSLKANLTDIGAAAKKTNQKKPQDSIRSRNQ